MQASTEAEGRASALGLSVLQYPSNHGLTTVYKIIDSLNGPLEGLLEIHDPVARTSCSSRMAVGMFRIITVSLNDQTHMEQVCSDVPDDLIAHYQLTGEDGIRWPYEDCVTRDQSNPAKGIVNDAPECRHHADYNYRSDELANAMKTATETIKKIYNYDVNAPWERDGTSLDAFDSIDQLERDYYIFSGSALRTELRHDGTIWTEYSVEDDFGQFLGDSVLVRTSNPWESFRYSAFIVVNRDTGELLSTRNRDSSNISAAFADWMINKHRWSLPLKICYSDCEDGAFNPSRFIDDFEDRQNVKPSGQNVFSTED